MNSIFRIALRNRAERLIKLLDINAPDSILANEAWLILKGALGLGTPMAAMIEDLTEEARNGLGICANVGCNAQITPDNTYPILCPPCQQCRDEGDADAALALGLDELEKYFKS